MSRGEHRRHNPSVTSEAFDVEASHSPQPSAALDEFLRPQLEVLYTARAIRGDTLTLASDFKKEADLEVRRALRLAQLAVYSYPSQTEAMLKEYKLLNEEEL